MVETTATKICSHCKLSIDKKAKKCHHCQTDLRSWFTKHPIITIFVVVPLFLATFTTVIQSEKDDTFKREASNLKYEVLKDSIVETPVSLKIDVYTTEKTDENLIKINNFLVSSNSKYKTHIYIKYFDDKAVAKEYSNKIWDDVTIEKDKDEMFSHFIANMVYNTETGLKQFNKNVNGDWVTLKKY